MLTSYDLLNVNLHLPEDTEEMALTIKGKKKKLTKPDFINFGLKLHLTDKQIYNSFNRFIKSKGEMVELIESSFLSKDYKLKYRELFEKRLQLFT